VAGPVVLRPVVADDRETVGRLLRDVWGSERQVVRGEEFRPAELPGFLALLGDRVAGLVTYSIRGDACEVMTLNSLVEGSGVGTALVDEVARMARAAGCGRLHVVTTNDNLGALRFYQRRGFRLAELRPGAVDESRRRIKPEIPEVGEFGIPIRDELEFELNLE
jgi:GNAT superfamily N-acetyltransferase